MTHHLYVQRHIVQRGETLSSIASQYGVAVADLIEFTGNYFRDPDVIFAGQMIVIPIRIRDAAEPEPPTEEPAPTEPERIPDNPVRAGPLAEHMMTKGPRVVRSGVAIPHGWATGNASKSTPGPGSDFLRNQAKGAISQWEIARTYRERLWPGQNGPFFQATIPLTYDRGLSARRQWRVTSCEGLADVVARRFDPEFTVQFARGAEIGVGGDLRIGHEPQPWYPWFSGYDHSLIGDVELGEAIDTHRRMFGADSPGLPLLQEVYETGNRGPLYREAFRHVSEMAHTFRLPNGQPAYTTCFNQADPAADPGDHGDPGDDTAGEPDDLSRAWNPDADPGAYHPDTNPGGADSIASDFYFRSGNGIDDFDSMLTILEEWAVRGGYRVMSFCEFGLFVHEDPTDPYPGANHDAQLAPKLQHAFTRFSELAHRGVLGYVSWWESLKTPTAPSGAKADYQLFESSEPLSWAVLRDWFPNE